MASFVEGNDDTFIVMLFAFFASICCLLVLELVLRRRDFVYDFRVTSAWLKNVMYLATADRRKLQIGYDMLKKNKSYTKVYVVPLWRRVLSRWRWACWVICITLLFSVAYQKLSFDPHEILGVPRTATDREIKKAYRKLSMLNHPDVNKTEEAAVIYPRVYRAFKVLRNPEDTDALANDPTDASQGPSVGLPKWLTNPDYALYSMTVLLSLLFAAPLYLLYYLKNKDSDRNFIPMLNDIAKCMEMAEPFIELLGQPHNPDLAFEAEQRPRIAALLRRLEQSSCFLPVDEVAFFSPSQLVVFHPDISSVADLRSMLMDIATNSKGARESYNRLMDCGMCVNKDMSPLIVSILSKEVPPTEAEVVRTRLVRERKARGWKAEDLTDEHFEGRTDDEAAVAEYFMGQPMNDALNALLRIFPQTEGGRPELARKLGKLYRDRCENFVYLKKQAKQAPNGKLQPNLKLHKECVLKAIDLAEQTDRFFFDIINERANLKAYKDRMSKAGGKPRK